MLYLTEAIDEAMVTNMAKFGDHDLVDVSKEGLELSDDDSKKVGGRCTLRPWPLPQHTSAGKHGVEGRRHWRKAMRRSALFRGRHGTDPGSLTRSSCPSSAGLAVSWPPALPCTLGDQRTESFLCRLCFIRCSWSSRLPSSRTSLPF